MQYEVQETSMAFPKYTLTRIGAALGKQSDVPDLMARIDFDLLTKMCLLSSGDTFDAAVWSTISLVHVVFQTILMHRIYQKITENSYFSDSISHENRWSTLIGVVFLSIFESATFQLGRESVRFRLYACLCAAIYVQMFCDVERAIVAADITRSIGGIAA
jgi:hypothetical protein